MKTLKNILVLAAVCCGIAAHGQSSKTHNSSFELGKGLNFSFNDGAYNFSIGGMMQPYFAVMQDSTENNSNYLNARRVYFNIGGVAMKEKISFFFQTDFAQPMPLLDAWVAFHPSSNIHIFLGQKQSISNNIELLVMEDQLQFTDRSLMSNSYSNLGREFGLFIETNFELGGVGIMPKAAITSGDGMNSFGADSRDTDLGGVKFSGRLEVYPFGFFSQMNDKSLSDFAHEDKFKLGLAAAASYNDGASNAVGEGHGDFTLYNALSQFQRPDYRQVYFDAIMKYMGFSLLAEYNVSTATGLTGAFLNESATVPLEPTQISEYLALGRGFNVQAGYVSKKGFGADVRYSATSPEFETNANSIIMDAAEWKFGVSRYMKANDLKITLQVSQLMVAEQTAYTLAELMFQLRM